MDDGDGKSKLQLSAGRFFVLFIAVVLYLQITGQRGINLPDKQSYCLLLLQLHHCNGHLDERERQKDNANCTTVFCLYGAIHLTDNSQDLACFQSSTFYYRFGYYHIAGRFAFTISKHVTTRALIHIWTDVSSSIEVSTETTQKCIKT